MKEVVIVGGVRTPIGSHGGAFRDLSAQEMAAIVMKEVIKRTGLDPNLIDELRRLDNRIKSSENILNSHISMTPFFAVLEDLTLKNVRFDQFEFNLTNSGLTALIMNGEAVDYATVVLQSDLMGQSRFLKDQIFSDVNLDEGTGNIRFSLRTTIDPGLVSFTSNIDNQE